MLRGGFYQRLLAVISQVNCSFWASKLGAKNILIFSVLLWSISTFITPLLAHSVVLLVICRILLGFAEGLGLPTIFHLFAHTIQVEERSRAFGYLLAAGSAGQTVASIICPHLPWQSSFYWFGSLGLMWILLWVVFYPGSGFVPENTLPLHMPKAASSKKIRWSDFIINKPLWAIYGAHFAMNWSSYIIMQWLPTYLSRHLQADSHSLSLTALPYIVHSVFGVLSGHIADGLLFKGWSVLSVRRLMTCIGLVGPGLFLAIFCVVNELPLALILVSISMGFLACNSAGHLSNHVDVAPNHSGTTFAISSTIATIPGILCGPVTAALVVAHDGKWLAVFLSATFVNLFGAFVYFKNSLATQVI
ncbi:sodium-dependent phosphate transport protein 1, chloroplastic isoform X2 [Agrilus planipennis]|uniref:Sodium-dependent phosphate transport protein 1, chloroplastic isoform X2 n=1 Tax=Agrilus planipennis TaxID=224129 RepID=A0A1W4XE49_AGRPL|nr:sodium-dependent phosphate transport protein 1, chloroplastic isoform X2 [Agrilus planipennis]